MSTPAQEKPRRRDVRVDYVGVILKDLGEQFVEGKDGLKPKLKASIDSGEIVEGDLYEARLDPASGTSVDVAQVLRLADEGVLTRAELVELVSAKVDPLRKRLDAPTFASISTTVQAEPRLVITRKKGVTVGVDLALIIAGRAVHAVGGALKQAAIEKGRLTRGKGAQPARRRAA